jgi:hypothetical protein
MRTVPDTNFREKIPSTGAEMKRENLLVFMQIGFTFFTGHESL